MRKINLLLKKYCGLTIYSVRKSNNSTILILLILLFGSCQKLTGDDVQPFLGKWKCNGYYTKDTNDNSSSISFDPIKESSVEIRENCVIFRTKEKELKLFVLKFEFGQYYENGGVKTEKLVIKTMDLKGQKRKLYYYIKDGFLRGDFYSKKGLTNSSDLNIFLGGYYLYHQFEKL